VTSDLQFEAGLYPTWFDNGGVTTDRLNPRIGVSWSPVESQWLRAFYREDTQFASNYTLSPISTIGQRRRHSRCRHWTMPPVT
jgi:hypothetical protein